MSCPVFTLLVILYLPGQPPAGSGDPSREKQRAEMEARLRKAEPMTETETARKKSNDQLTTLLGAADRMELFQLEPDGVGASPAEKAVAFHGYKIAARVAVDKADQRTALITSLGRELHWYEGWKAYCFNPRHGLRVVVGKDTMDFVLCFECGKMKKYLGNKELGETVLLGSKWEAADKLLAGAKGPLKK